MTPIFARIYKIDELTRTVTGRAAQEVVDRDNEMFDYASSKPEFMKWSAEVHSDSNGQSLGNVRSMHGNVAAGKLVDIQFLDDERAIDVSAKIVDDNEWEKCLEGVHTGFSIGGRYAKKWAEAVQGKLITRYTAVPSEISIVDRPCCPTAKFYEVHKRDGSTERHEFQNVLPQLILSKDGGVTMSDPNGFVEPKDSTTGIQDYDLEGQGRKKPKPISKPTNKSKKRADEDDDEDEDACHDDDVTKGGPGIAKFSIVEMDDDALAKFYAKNARRVQELDLVKGVYDVASLSQLIAQLHSITCGAFQERKVEGDDSVIPEKLRAAAANLLSILSAMAAEEAEETTDGTTAEDVMRDSAPSMMIPGLYCADGISDMAKALRDALFGTNVVEKRGARNSAKDLELLQKAHDALSELGAACKQRAPHEMNGESVNPQETMQMATANKADTIAAEGNKRGAAVSDPKPGLNSDNAVDPEMREESSTGAVRTMKAKKAKARFDEDAVKRKARADEDEDEDDDEDMDEDDMDDDEDDDTDEDDDDSEDDAPPPKKSKMKGKAKKFAKSLRSRRDERLAATIAGAVAAAFAPIMEKALGGREEMTPVFKQGQGNVAPNLMSVNRDGSAQKFVGIEELRKSVAPCQAGVRRNDAEDQDTATLIKAIRANPAFRLRQEDIPG